MKKRLSIILVFAMLFSVLIGKAESYAAEAGEISVTNVSGKPGDTVELSVNMDKNPGIISIYLSIEYDENALKLNSINDEKLLTDYMAGSLDNNPFSVSWEMATAPANVTSTGTLLTMSFTILEDAKEGKYEVTVDQLGKGNIIDYDLNDVPFNFTNGYITVEKQTHEHIYDGKQEIVKKPTCTEEGTKRIYCSVEECNQYIEKIIPAEGHSYGEWITVKEPSIGTEGLKERTCSECGNVERQTIPAIVHGDNDHIYDGKQEIVKDPTCTEEGTLRKHCSFEGCNAYIEETIPADGHTAGEWETIENAGCTTEGKKVQICTVCQSVITEEIIPATGHSYGEWTTIKEPAIGVDGLKERVCSVCGEKEKQTIPAIVHGDNDHIYDGKQEIVKDPTCTEEGTLRKHCSFEGCNAYIEETIPADGHTAGEWETIENAGCTTEGKKVQICTVCQSVITEEIIPATGHSYSEWVTITEPGIGTDGMEERQCSVCGNSESRIIPAIVHGDSDHVYDGEQEIVKEPTCIEEGTLRKYCSFEGCDAYIEESVSANGHTAGEWETIENASCITDGKKVQICTVCQSVITEEIIPATGHSYGEWMIIKEPAIGVDGLKERICSVCGTEEKQIIPAIVHGDNDHIYDVEEIIKEPTCTEKGTSRTYCSFEGCNSYIEKTIPEKGHDYSDWEIVKKEAIGVKGEKQRICSVCGSIETAEIPALAEISDTGNPETEGETKSTEDSGQSETVIEGSVKTGDSMNVFIWFIIIAAAFGTIIITAKKGLTH